MSKIYTVSCCCVPESDAILLEFLLSMLEKQTDALWQLASDMSGDIAIFDVDEKAGLDLYHKMTAEDNASVAVVFSADFTKVESEYGLSKPLRSADFLTIAKQIIEKHPDIGRVQETNPEASVITKNSAADNSDKGSNAQIKIKRPEIKRLYNLLTEDIEVYKNPVEVIYREVSFFIDFSSKQFYCEHKLMLLSMLCKADVEKLEIKEITSYEINKIEQVVKGRPLNELIWCCVLLGSSGELIEKLDENSLLHLKRWPNLKALVHLPRHITLTAFMTKHTATLAEIVTQTRVLPENIIDFVNACQILGYMDDKAVRKEPELVMGNETTEKQGLFGKIRNKFGRKAG